MLINRKYFMMITFTEYLRLQEFSIESPKLDLQSNKKLNIGVANTLSKTVNGLDSVRIDAPKGNKFVARTLEKIGHDPDIQAHHIEKKVGMDNDVKKMKKRMKKK